MDDLREAREGGDIVSSFNRLIRSLKRARRIVEASEFSLAVASSSTEISTPACQPGRLVFIQPATLDAIAANAYIDFDNGILAGRFVVTHGLTAVDAEARFRYFIT